VIAGATRTAANTELYNGTSWTEVNDLNLMEEDRNLVEHGTQTAVYYWWWYIATLGSNT
jgi:hypothetical protein